MARRQKIKEVKVLRDADLIEILNRNNIPLYIRARVLKNYTNNLPDIPNEEGSYTLIVENNILYWVEYNENNLGVTINNNTFAGVTSLIEESYIINIPENWEYNLFKPLIVEGTVELEGEINFI